MTALAIVKQLDVIELGRAGVVAILKRLMERPLVLQRAEEALHDGVVGESSP